MNPGRNSPCPCGSGLKYKNCCGRLSETYSSTQPPGVNGKLPQARSSATIKIAGDISIRVPDSLGLITPYILREQEKWFEDEIGFVRKILRPGARVIDIGANYGVYTLSMARAVGNHGHVWAFEPTTSTADFLKASVALNQFENVTVIQSALSKQIGKANLYIHPDSEGNRLVSGAIGGGEEVAVTTLDRCMSEIMFREIEFIKIDAEGEEHNILLGGKEFLSTQSPLIMFEIKHGETLNFSLVNQFADLGYSSYRLIPGLNLLAPFGLEETADPYLLNLFCCKGDRAVKLENAGWLVRNHPGEQGIGGDTAKDNAWENAFYSLPFAQVMKDQWRSQKESETWPESDSPVRAIELYFIAHANPRTGDERYKALRACFDMLKRISDRNPKLTNLSSFARVAAEMGFRSMAVQAVVKQLQMLNTRGDVQFGEPFLPACARFDRVDPGGRLNDWFLASLIEVFEILNSYSSFYTGQSTLRNLEVARKLGFQSPEMERRRQLIRMRHGIQTGAESSPLLQERTESNLNPEFWRTIH